MLTLNDGRNELWQWDTKRKLTVDADCSQVHFSNKVFGRSIDVDVIDGSAIIPDILLQTDKDLSVWSFVGTADNGYTKISKVFKVNRRNKPADYVFTPPDQTSIEEIKEKLEHLESIQDPDAIKNAVEDYLEHNPVEAPVQSVNGKTGKVKLTALDVGAISQDDLQEATNEALAQAKASGEFNGKDGQDYVLTHDDKTEIAEMAAALVEVPDSGGNVDQSDSVFKGKTASFYGDSLTEVNYHYTKGYHSWVKDLLGLASYNNYGKSGYKVSDVYNKVNSVTDTADIVFVMCGINDQDFSVPLGTMGDSTTGTTYGALNLLCALLKQKYPTSILVFITPNYQTKYSHNNGITSYEVSKAIREVCEKYAIPVYDNFVLSGIYSTNLSAFTTDNCHWNDIAHEMVGKNLAKFVTDSFRYVYGNTSGEGGDSGGEGETTVSVTGVTLNAESGTLTEGENVTLVATVLPSNATNKKVTWKSSNNSVATVSDGVVSALSDGTATITATTEDGGFTAMYTLTVEADNAEDVVLKIINGDSVTNPTYENQTFTIASVRDTFGGVLFENAIEMQIGLGVNDDILNKDNSSNGKQIGWLCGYDSGVYHAMGVSTAGNIETWDFSGDPLSASNNNKATGVKWEASEKIIVRVESGNVNMYFDNSNEPAFSVPGDAIAYIASNVKTKTLYGVTFS